jgi:hypothetical protein
MRFVLCKHVLRASGVRPDLHSTSAGLALGLHGAPAHGMDCALCPIITPLRSSRKILTAALDGLSTNESVCASNGSSQSYSPAI